MFLIHGYYANPDKAREVARFTFSHAYDNLQRAQELAQEWHTSKRYAFIEITDKDTRKRIGNILGGNRNG
jgi:hypothetical protein